MNRRQTKAYYQVYYNGFVVKAIKMDRHSKQHYMLELKHVDYICYFQLFTPLFTDFCTSAYF